MSAWTDRSCSSLALARPEESRYVVARYLPLLRRPQRDGAPRLTWRIGDLSQLRCRKRPRFRILSSGVTSAQSPGHESSR